MPRDLGRHAGLSYPHILAVARELAARDGLDRLTIRSLASALGVAPNAVYGWVDSKAALLNALVDDALAEVAQRSIEDDRSDPAIALETLLIDVFDALMRRPELAPLFLDRSASPGPNATRIRMLLSERLVAAGTADDEVAAAVPVLLVHVIGFAAFVQQTHGARLLQGPGLGSPRDLFVRGLGWLLAGMRGQCP